MRIEGLPPEDIERLANGINRLCAEHDEEPRPGDSKIGAKNDHGKQMPDLVLGDFAQALAGVVKVGTFGAHKYTEHGWLHVEDGIKRYKDAMMRHWLAEKAGEERDPDSGLLHAEHFAWNALAILELKLRSQNSEEG